MQPNSIYARLSRRSTRKRDFYARPSSQQIISNSCLREIGISYIEKKNCYRSVYLLQKILHSSVYFSKGINCRVGGGVLKRHGLWKRRISVPMLFWYWKGINKTSFTIYDLTRENFHGEKYLGHVSDLVTFMEKSNAIALLYIASRWL